MRYRPRPRIHQVVFKLVLNDFIFLSPNLSKYYEICEPLLQKDPNDEYYREKSTELARMVGKELDLYSKNYKMHGRHMHGILFEILIASYKRGISNQNKSGGKDLNQYFKEFLFKKANDVEIPSEDLKEYERMMNQIKEEYEKLKDEPIDFGDPYLKH